MATHPPLDSRTCPSGLSLGSLCRIAAGTRRKERACVRTARPADDVTEQWSSSVPGARAARYSLQSAAAAPPVCMRSRRCPRTRSASLLLLSRCQALLRQQQQQQPLPEQPLRRCLLQVLQFQQQPVPACTTGVSFQSQGPWHFPQLLIGLVPPRPTPYRPPSSLDAGCFFLHLLQPLLHGLDLSQNAQQPNTSAPPSGFAPQRLLCEEVHAPSSAPANTPGSVHQRLPLHRPQSLHPRQRPPPHSPPPPDRGLRVWNRAVTGVGSQ